MPFDPRTVWWFQSVLVWSHSSLVWSRASRSLQPQSCTVEWIHLNKPSAMWINLGIYCTCTCNVSKYMYSTCTVHILTHITSTCICTVHILAHITIPVGVLTIYCTYRCVHATMATHVKYLADRKQEFVQVQLHTRHTWTLHTYWGMRFHCWRSPLDQSDTRRTLACQAGATVTQDPSSYALPQRRHSEEYHHRTHCRDTQSGPVLVRAVL